MIGRKFIGSILAAGLAMFRGNEAKAAHPVAAPSPKRGTRAMPPLPLPVRASRIEAVKVHTHDKRLARAAKKVRAIRKTKAIKVKALQKARGKVR